MITNEIKMTGVTFTMENKNNTEVIASNSREMTIHSNYFYGHEVSKCGMENGYVDYATFAKCGDLVLFNEISQFFYRDVNGKYIEPEQINGLFDNSEEIENLREKIEELEEQIVEYEDSETNSFDELSDEQIDEEIDSIREEIEELENQAEELEREYDEREIFQYYVINKNLADVLQDWTNEIVYYIAPWNIYVWGVTHCGMSWDCVLTNIRIDLKKEV